MRTLDDSTPLNGAAIDVASRIGWAIRMARTTTPGVRDSRLQALAGRLGSSPAHLSRVETGQRRDGSLVHRYEGALDLPDGSLWAPIAILCRTFPALSPRDSGPVENSADVQTFSQLTHHVSDPTSHPTGSDWLTWTRGLAAPGNIGLPVPLFAEIATRLATELSHSTGPEHAVRHEAMSILRCSAYGDLLLDLARDTFAAARTNVTRNALLLDLAVVIGQAATTDAVKWALDLLGEEPTAEHGARALEWMGQTVPAFWDELALPLLAIFDGSESGTAVENWATHLMRIVPRDVWAASGAVPSRPMPPQGVITDWNRTLDNPLWNWCTTQSNEISADLRISPQPVLTRMLFELVFAPWETRAATSAFMIATSAQVAASVPRRIAAFIEANVDCDLRARAARRLVTLLRGEPLPEIAHWSDSDDPLLRRTASEIARVSVPAQASHVPAPRNQALPV